MSQSFMSRDPILKTFGQRGGAPFSRQQKLIHTSSVRMQAMKKECSECDAVGTKQSGIFSASQWNNKGSDDIRCKTCVSEASGVGGYYTDSEGNRSFRTIRNDWTERYSSTAGDETFGASVDTDDLLETGAFKEVYMGRYTRGARHGEQCVSKMFRSHVQCPEDYFDKEVKASKVAAEIIESFNNEGIAPRSVKIRINMPSVRLLKGGTKCLLEPFVHNFEKFNSNTGWYDQEASEENEVDAVMQALSHYSYHVTDGKYVLCDLQGGRYLDGVILTDPTLHSLQAEQFGGADLGPKGISTFFGRHECNEYCQDDWTEPRKQHAFFKRHMGTSLIGFNGIPRKANL